MLHKAERISFLSLGCPRNLVDTEVMMGILKKKGYIIEENMENSDIAIINTCGFIKDATQESIDIILKVIRLKKEGNLKNIVVTGCLSQRYEGELKKELPEVDAFLGTSDFVGIADVIKNVSARYAHTINIEKRPAFLYDHMSPRVMLTPPHYAYIKISEGCGNNCSYCIIKALRGSFRSRDLTSIIKEAESLSKDRCLKEIVLIGQDTTLYGTDLYKKPKITELLKRLSALNTFGWIRLLYAHPAHIEDSLIEVMQGARVICRYVDLPIQHINDKILKNMNRNITKSGIIKLIEKLRKRIPGLAIRTSLIVGFPGETEVEFQELRDFIREIGFERLGVFLYSREEGTPAFGFKGQVSEKIKKERFDEIMKVQQEISRVKNEKFLGQTLNVLIDEKNNNDPGTFLARTEFDAPEVDGMVYVKSKSKNQKSKIEVGKFVKVKIIDTLEYDLVGAPVDESA
ncbi:MAG: 30S ribosomal protein S12 methylthiotransferase RimO [Candidatus Omnitrophota bacterium]